jgi:ATP-binding cassette subfamily F protein 3
LFSLIMGRLEPDTGTVTLERGARIGFLPQETAAVGKQTVLELATEGIAHDDEYDHTIEPLAKQVLNGLAFRQADFNRPVGAMSGGWVMRAHLARLLVRKPDLLLLDEPTNHLDLESLVWFQNYLKGYPGAILVVSHDREFLNQLCGSILAIQNGRLQRYRGNYEDYLAQREAREAQQLAAFKNQQREIESLQRFADRFRAKASKASQAQAKLKQIERMEKVEAPEAEDRKIKFRFPQPPRSGLKVVTLKDVHHAYGDLVVYRGMNFQAERGDRTVLVGPNGAGKSTLLKILAGVLAFQSGQRELGLNVKVGYYAQHRVEMLQAVRTVLEEALDSPQRIPEQFARTVLGSFLFRGDDVFKQVNVLSGGEKSRLALVKLLLNPPNLLLMDEPTTHLDMASIEALIAALKQYEGTLIFISHDVHFIRSLATSVMHIHAGQLTRYVGDYQYYLDKSQAVSERAALVAGAKVTDGRPDEMPPAQPVRFKTKEQKRLEAEQRQAESRAKREREKRIASVESEIERLEARQAELTGLLENPATYHEPGKAMELNRELAGIVESLEKLNAEWTALV